MPEHRRDHHESSAPGPDIEARLRRAMLEVSGTRGYRGLTVQHVLDRAGVSRTAFYHRYDNKGDCFAAAYAAAGSELVDRLLSCCDAAGNWRDGMLEALRSLAALLRDDPVLANAILVQPRVAGGPSAEIRRELHERLAGAIDRARAESDVANLPPLAAKFVLSAIEELAVSAVARDAPESFAAEVPDLAFLAIATYFGPELAAHSRGMM